MSDPDDDDLADLADLLLRSGRRPWREMAPFRQTVLVQFTDPDLRSMVETLCEVTLDEALEFETGSGLAEEPVAAQLRALLEDLWHSKGFAIAVAATPHHVKVSAQQAHLCRWAVRCARVLEALLGELEPMLGQAPAPIAIARHDGLVN